MDSISVFDYPPILAYYSLADYLKDIATYYALFMADIMSYGHDGLKLLIERGWMEKPPQPIDRKEFYKS